MKAEVKNHFERLFHEVGYSRLVLDGVNFSQINAEDNFLLTTPFSPEEIKDAIWSCDGDKCPGPDGFNFQFYKKFWNILKDEVCAFI